MASPTREDAQIMIQLAQLGTALGVQDAMPELFSDDFDPHTADALDNEAVRTILMFGETIATLTNRDLLSAELITDWLWVEGSVVAGRSSGAEHARAVRRAKVVREFRGAGQALRDAWRRKLTRVP